MRIKNTSLLSEVDVSPAYEKRFPNEMILRSLSPKDPWRLMRPATLKHSLPKGFIPIQS
jgi:hypothetical protein